MYESQNDIHSKSVEDWENKAAKGLTPDQHVLLLEKAISAVEVRACVTLSSVTLMVVLERVLQKCCNDFPILSTVVLDPHFLSFEELHNNENYNSDDISQALRFLLLELLRVLGRITAEILTVPLHNQLLEVTWNESEKI